MRVPKDAVIPDDKITRYLLVQKARNDKSKFLAQAGFSCVNPAALKAAIQSLTESVEVVKDRSNKYGTFYQAAGELVGVNGVNLAVVIIWLQRQIDGKFQFVTLKPCKET